MTTNPDILYAQDYLKSGGLGEVEGMARLSLDLGSERVACDTATAIALCMLAEEGINAAVVLDRRQAELLEANNRYLERAQTAEAEVAKLTNSLEHLRKQARARGDFLACVGCEKEMFAGERYFPDVNGGQCAECAPTYQALIDDNEGFVDPDENARTSEQCRAEFEAHIAAGGQATDSMANRVLE